MAAEKTRADSIREYLSGAGSDGGTQAAPDSSLGNFRSSTEAASYGIITTNAIPFAVILFASGNNPFGNGLLVSATGGTLTWQPHGAASPGPTATYSAMNEIQIIEGPDPSQFLRVQLASSSFGTGQSTISLIYVDDNVFGLNDISIANASAGITQYRATIVRNEATGAVSSFQRYLAQLGTVQGSSTVLGVSGSGTLGTTGTFTDWPATGYCQVRSSSGTLKEVVYYSSKVSTNALIVPAAGRGLLGTSATLGLTSDSLYAVPGIAIGMDTHGSQSFGSAIASIGNDTTAPAGIAWNLEITPAGGLQIGTLNISQQIGIWFKRQIPAGCVATPQALNKVIDSFNAF